MPKILFDTETGSAYKLADDADITSLTETGTALSLTDEEKLTLENIEIPE